MRSRFVFSLLVAVAIVLMLGPPSAVAAPDVLEEGMEKLSAGDTSGAIALLVRAVQEEPESVRTRLWLAKAYYLGLETEKAVSEWRKVLELSPENEEAGGYLDRIGQVNKRAADRYAFAEELFRNELYEEASQEAERTLKMTDPGEYGGKLRLLAVRCAVAMDRHLWALQSATELVRLFPEDPIVPEARVLIASVLGRKLGRIQEAKLEIQSVLDDYPGTEAAAEAELELSRIAVATGQPLAAVEGYKAWLIRHAESEEAPAAMLELAKLQVKLGELAKPEKIDALIPQHGEAMETLKGLEKAHPTSRTAGGVLGVLESLAEFYRGEGAYQVAVGIREEMVGRYARRPEHARIVLSLSSLLVEKGLERFEENKATGLSAKNEELLAEFARAIELATGVIDAYPQEAEEALGIVFSIVNHYRGNKLWKPAIECAQFGMGEEGEKKGGARLMGELVKLHADSADEQWVQEEKAGRKPEAELRAGYASALEAYVRLAKLFPEAPEVIEAQNRLIAVAKRYEEAGLGEVARAVFDGATEMGATADWAALQKAAVGFREGMKEIGRELPAGLSAEELAGVGLSQKVGLVLSELQKVVEDFPESRYAVAARGKILELGHAHASNGAFGAAREVYTSFLLRKPELPGRDEFEYAIAASFYQEAAAEFSRARPKPAGLTAKFQKAIKELTGFAKMSSKSKGAEQATGNALAVGQIYAKAGNWEVAREAFRLFGQEYPEFREPMMMELLAALCHVGEAMPEHALTQMGELLGEKGATTILPQRRAEPGNVPAQTQQQVQVEALVPAPGDIEVALKSFPKAYARLKGVMAASLDEREVDRAAGIVKAMSDFYRRNGRSLGAAGLLERLLSDFPKMKGVQQSFLAVAGLHLAHATNLSLGGKEDQAKLEGAFEDALAKYGAFLERWPGSPLSNQAREGVVEGLMATGARLMEVSRPRAGFFLEKAADEAIRLNVQFGARASDFPDRWASRTLTRIASAFSTNEQWEEAAGVGLRLSRTYPNAPEARDAALEAARVYAENLDQPIDALDLYLSYMAGWGPPDQVMGAIYGMGTKLAGQQRWVEAKMIFETYAAAFPKAPNAPDALGYVAKVYEEGRAWESAIGVYESIVSEYPASNAARDARLRIPVCQADLSKWYEAAVAASRFAQDYPQDPAAKQMKENAQVYWTLKNYQDLVSSEDNSKKLDDAQFQLATIVLERLGDRVKAAEEFQRVVDAFPKSYRADDAKFSVGKILLDLGKLVEAREEFVELVKLYPDSDRADDALYWAGVTYEREAKKYEVLTAEDAKERARIVAQVASNLAVNAYDQYVSDRNEIVRGKLEAKYREAATGPEAGRILADDIVSLAEAGAKAGAWEQQKLAYRGFAISARRKERELAALQIANKEDKRKEALRNAVVLFERTAEEYQLGDLADEALLSAAKISYEVLEETARAMKAYQLLAQHYPGSPIAEEAAYRIGDFYQSEQKWAEAIKAHEQFIYNYPKSGWAADAQFAIGECYVQLGNWTKAIDAFQAYINKHPNGDRLQEAKERMDWIRTYYL